MKAEAEIHSQWWKIKWEDISIQTAKASFGSSCSEVSKVIVYFFVCFFYFYRPAFPKENLIKMMNVGGRAGGWSGGREQWVSRA